MKENLSKKSWKFGRGQNFVKCPKLAREPPRAIQKIKQNLASKPKITFKKRFSWPPSSLGQPAGQPAASTPCWVSYTKLVCRQDMCCVYRQDICCVCSQDICCVSRQEICSLPRHPLGIADTGAAAPVWGMRWGCCGRLQISCLLTQQVSWLQTQQLSCLQTQHMSCPQTSLV